MVNVRNYALYWIWITMILSLYIGYDCKKNMAELLHLQAITQSMQAALPRVYFSPNESNKIRQQIKLIPQTQNSILLQLIHIIETKGFNIESLQPMSMINFEDYQLLPVKLSIKGQNNQLLALLIGLTESHLQLGINDFTLQMHDNGLLDFEMNILLLCAELKQEPLLNKMNQAMSSLQNVTIKQLKFAGYVHNEQDYFALIQLPDGSSQMVKRGERIAQENAQITQITENVIVATDGQRQIIIR